jgi:hypothetical protein
VPDSVSTTVPCAYIVHIWSSTRDTGDCAERPEAEQVRGNTYCPQLIQALAEPQGAPLRPQVQSDAAEGEGRAQSPQDGLDHL